MTIVRFAAALAAVSAAVAFGEAVAQQMPPAYSATQAARGAELYQEKCTLCHGADLSTGQFGPSLKGTRFKRVWGGKPAAELFAYMAQNMPPGEAASLSPDQHADLLAYVLQGNGVAAGSSELASDPKAIGGTLPQ